MTDLTKRLRRNGEIAGNAGRACNLYFEAADEIDRLTADLTAERAHADMLAQALAAIDTKGELDAEIAQLESVRAKKEEAGE